MPRAPAALQAFLLRNRFFRLSFSPSSTSCDIYRTGTNGTLRTSVVLGNCTVTEYFSLYSAVGDCPYLCRTRQERREIGVDFLKVHWVGVLEGNTSPGAEHFAWGLLNRFLFASSNDATRRFYYDKRIAGQ
ncbi:hypothetical protein BaRGS_00009310 [Batillaria attramentaria]|uniref:Uncharacterized protein n=1 Tax=Batillaria attramentaria TaxID=370345 RepID=A0ABD0LIX3_9CAEN